MKPGSEHRGTAWSGSEAVLPESPGAPPGWNTPAGAGMCYLIYGWQCSQSVLLEGLGSGCCFEKLRLS